MIWQNAVSSFGLAAFPPAVKHKGRVGCILNFKLGWEDQLGLILLPWYLPHLFQPK